MPFDATNPLAMDASQWLANGGTGNSGSGNSFTIGQANQPDESDATVVAGMLSTNAAFVAWNNPGLQASPLPPGVRGDGYIGLFGRTSGITRSVGVVGLTTVAGCGVYGICGNADLGLLLGETVPLFHTGYATGIGVAGRAMDGAEVEFQNTLGGVSGFWGFDLAGLLYWLTPGPSGPGYREVFGIGVLGTSTSNIGVRGHGGLLQGLGFEPGSTPPVPVDLSEARGGVFSSGLLVQSSRTQDKGEWTTEGSIPQVWLIPFMNLLSANPPTPNGLPPVGRLGDLYTMAEVGETGETAAVSCSMFLCIQSGAGTPAQPTLWARLKLADRRQFGPPSPITSSSLGTSFDPDDPFRMGSNWLTELIIGPLDGSAMNTGDDIELGTISFAGSQDATELHGGAAENAVLFVQNAGSAASTSSSGAMPTQADIDGVVGIYARSCISAGGATGFVPPYDQTSMLRTGVGALGSADRRGTGVCGISATREKNELGIVGGNPRARVGIGVAGRAMYGFEVEDPGISLEDLFDSSIGVLGTSVGGVGVRGYSGPLRAITSTLLGPLGAQQVDPIDHPVPIFTQPGGVFSAGELSGIIDNGIPTQVSLDPIPQMRLIPSEGLFMPAMGRIGDLFVKITGGAGADVPPSCSMFLCVGSANGSAEWAEFRLGPPEPGG